jgi:hypothetical protein
VCRAERLKPARDADIAKRMSEMPEMIAKWKEDKSSKKKVLTSDLQKILNTEKANY